MRKAWLMIAAHLIAAALLLTRAGAAQTESAVFAGGCFWCMEEAFDKVEGVLATTSGYTGGAVQNPSYRQVSGGGTGHFEAVKVDYDPAKVSYQDLLEVYWRNIDPFDAIGQFCDKGDQYRSAIFVGDQSQRSLAEASKDEVVKRFNMDVATEILPEQAFYPAEDYHQDYHSKNVAKYEFYKYGCGRPARLQELWGTPGA
jgi:peptide-methionine (S)-S-oxide reductase